MNGNLQHNAGLAKPSGVQWQARWIWGGLEESSRNEWRCFRRDFTMPEEGFESAALSITADSRYIVYVNGVRLGRGPNRSWTFEQSCDKHEVGYLLRAGATNTIAVLVMHFGVATFSYTLGRPGLLAQLDVFQDGNPAFTIGTDRNWRTSIHEGYERHASRMSCQLAFTERVDAERWDEAWTIVSCLQGSWLEARELGEPGMEPWTTVVPSELPPLTEEPMWPVRIRSLHAVEPVAHTFYLDVRAFMAPDSIRHANPMGYVGYVYAVIRADRDGRGTIGFPNGYSPLIQLGLNGNLCRVGEMDGVSPERYWNVSFKQGDNLLWLQLAGSEHGQGLHLGIDADVNVEICSPTKLESSQHDASPFAGIGPFATFEWIDHQDNTSPLMDYVGFHGSRELDEQAFAGYDDYKQLQQVATAAELASFAHLLRDFPTELVGRDSVFALSVWHRSRQERPVPYELQQAVMPNALAGTVPSYEGKDTELIIDFGRELSGYIELELDAPAGTIVDCYGFEYMASGFRQDTYGLDNTLRYRCKEGRQSYTSAVRRGFRYLMVTVRGAARPVKLHGVRMLQSNYPIAEIGRFQCSDPLLDRIWEISKHTTRLCMEDTFVDCPAYEQTFWVGDSRNEALVNYYVFGATDIVKRCLQLVPGSREQSPFYADQVPSGWSSVIPNWTFFWAKACAEYVEHTGDREFAKSIWPHVKFTLTHYLGKLDDRGLLHMKGWNLLDWAPIDQPGDGVVTHQNAILVSTLHSASELARIAGSAEEGVSFAEEGERLRAAINEHLWSETEQAYLDCIHADGRASDVLSMQTQVVAYLCGIAAGDRALTLERYIIAPPPSFVQIGSPFMSFFYYEALVKLGQHELMVQDMRKHYGQMVEHDATTCWEMYPNFAENRANPDQLTRSHCHAWSAAPGYFLGANVLGVRSGAEGWKRVVVAPQPSGLAWARGCVPLPQGGQVEVAWRIIGDSALDLHVRLPADLELDIELPEGWNGTTKVERIGSS
ncbi:hypothetical protein FHS18_003127 [Paenibacillus phyllosphaerae]|uniref:Alpha-L-rhamnosidase n=1 Tax=Paenibacillus phyllosphaerae TaxID=274593 RepID=A0A7W5FNJ1_9BACL|nr:family 78 glycoside hydrolase catalytic domain [Paenibacillus phyllosphaerae]MBB3111059.1 hypothetical protein [Paenibacillus phyllosphaerae]